MRLHARETLLFMAAGPAGESEKEKRRTAQGRTREGESKGSKEKNREESEPRKTKRASELLYEKALGLHE